MEIAPKPIVLVLDDEKNIRQAIRIALEPEGFEVIEAHEVAAAVRALQRQIIDLMVLDIRLGEIDGLTLYRKLQSDGIVVPTIFISGHATLSEAAQAIKMGAFDFVEKPFSAEKMAIVVRRCHEYATLEERARRADARSAATEIIGDSLAIRRVVDDALRVAKTQASVLITGESGTGKELLASAIHAHSDRRDAAFVRVNCSAIPENLVESQLFGHERGAFTGASARKRGLFEVAHRGTIFLDEVADLSRAAQAKILRVLQSGEVQKVGADEPVIVDVRVLSATHKNLKALVDEGLFRDDLLYRLNVVPIRMPSLRERPEDIPLLAKFFVERLCAKNNLRTKVIDDEVLWELKLHPWPGNVRELVNALERMVIMSGERITAMDLPEEIVASDTEASKPRSAETLKAFRDRTEREHIVEALKRNGGNISQTALELGISRTYLHRRLALLGITKKEFFA